MAHPFRFGRIGTFDPTQGFSGRGRMRDSIFDKDITDEKKTTKLYERLASRHDMSENPWGDGADASALAQQFEARFADNQGQARREYSGLQAKKHGYSYIADDAAITNEWARGGDQDFKAQYARTSVAGQKLNAVEDYKLWRYDMRFADTGGAKIGSGDQVEYQGGGDAIDKTQVQSAAIQQGGAERSEAVGRADRAGGKRPFKRQKGAGGVQL